MKKIDSILIKIFRFASPLTRGRMVWPFSLGWRGIDSSARLLYSTVARSAVVGASTEVIRSTIGDNVRVGSGCQIRGSVLYGEVIIQRNTSLWGPGIHIHSEHHPISIGSFCSIARNISIYESNHQIHRPTTYYVQKRLFGKAGGTDTESKGEVVIGHDVWIGVNTVILSGVSISHGAVIAAGSVVNRDVPPYSIVGGVPAKILGYRFDPEIIDKMLDLCWWDWDNEKILANEGFFSRYPDFDAIQ